MKFNAKPLNLTIALTSAMCMTLFLQQTLMAKPNIETAKSTAVASINLSEMLSKLEESTNIGKQLQKMTDEMQAELEAKQDKFDKMKEQLEQVPKTSDSYQQLQTELVLEAAALNAWVTANKELKALDEALLFHKLYNKIIEASAELAEIRGYDFVILDDSDTQIQAQNMRDLFSQIFSRNVIYRNKAQDITAELIDRMNNSYNAGIG